jgi:hypothetical protein
VKLIFDATFSETGVTHLRSFFQSHRVPRPVLTHIHELGARDQQDDVWLPRLEHEDCLVISGDRGRHLPRLPKLCTELKKTHIILSPALQEAPQFVKLRAIIVMWPHIVQACDCPKGSRFQIQATDARHEHFKWTRKG